MQYLFKTQNFYANVCCLTQTEKLPLQQLMPGRWIIHPIIFFVLTGSGTDANNDSYNFTWNKLDNQSNEHKTTTTVGLEL